MTKLRIRALLMLGLIAVAFSANANDRGYRAGFETGNGGGWRLGEHRGGGYAIYYQGHRMPGEALDVADGWVIGTDRRAGGFGIYRWNGRRWNRVSGGAVRIGGSYDRPWVINDRNRKYVWNGRGWNEVRHTGGYGFNRDHRDRGYRNSFDRHDDRRYEDRNRRPRDRDTVRRGRW